ncbi:hypothetical protein ARMGADRAFT_1092925 [Armillaria gallica]|uniref:Uncharacterized protein n=1 Tax=Armillaria gallica TaxID=47427 RepID=A0A2H3C9A3_ARMGA|nr:hypothetical protein ARMGADRAFT_1092925 [Armillaria gallica]
MSMEEVDSSFGRPMRVRSETATSASTTTTSIFLHALSGVPTRHFTSKTGTALSKSLNLRGTTPVLFALRLGTTMPGPGLCRDVPESEMWRYGQGIRFAEWFLYAKEVSSYSALADVTSNDVSVPMQGGQLELRSDRIYRVPMAKTHGTTKLAVAEEYRGHALTRYERASTFCHTYELVATQPSKRREYSDVVVARSFSEDEVQDVDRVRGLSDCVHRPEGKIRFFVRVGNITKDVAELIVPSDLNLSIYVYNGIWRQSDLKHQVDLQEVELDALPVPVAADLVEVCAVYGGVSRLEWRTLLMVSRTTAIHWCEPLEACLIHNSKLQLSRWDDLTRDCTRPMATARRNRAPPHIPSEVGTRRLRSGLEFDIRVSSDRVVEWWWYNIKVVIVISHVTSTLTITTLGGRATFSTAHIGKTGLGFSDEAQGCFTEFPPSTSSASPTMQMSLTIMTSLSLDIGQECVAGVPRDIGRYLLHARLRSEFWKDTGGSLWREHVLQNYGAGRVLSFGLREQTNISVISRSK